MTTGMNKQGGFSAIIAVVLIVLFSLIGAYMATLSSVSAVTTASSGAAIQAWFAATSGMQWAVHRALNLVSCGGVDGQTINFTGGGLSGFQAQIGCVATSVTEAPVTYNIYNISVSASRGSVGDAGYASRTIIATATDRTAP